MKAKLTFLGTGTSQGIPMIGCGCDVCKSADERDKRLRASALVEYGGLTILIDAGPDFRQQLIRAGVTHLDAVLLTHNHKDHTGGLDDLRAFNLIEHRPVNIYCEKYVEDALRKDYSYAFAEPRYPGAPEWRVHNISNEPFTLHSNISEDTLVWETGKGYRIEPGTHEIINPVEVIPVRGWHHKEKDLSVLGYRFGDIAYLTDMNLIEDEELEKLKGVKYVTLNCVKRGPHYSHFSLAEVLDIFERIGAEQSFITHISHLIPRYELMEAELPDGVHYAYDGLVLEAD